MGKNRLEAFSDGVIAILITIMVLELKVPHGDDLAALLPLWPVFLSYVLSFIYIGIYWNKLQYVCYPLFLSRLSSLTPNPQAEPSSMATAGGKHRPPLYKKQHADSCMFLWT
jgi:hypothetical protein